MYETGCTNVCVCILVPHVIPASCRDQFGVHLLYTSRCMRCSMCRCMLPHIFQCTFSLQRTAVLRFLVHLFGLTTGIDRIASCVGWVSAIGRMMMVLGREIGTVFEKVRSLLRP